MSAAPPFTPLIDAAALAARLGDDGLLIVDCRFDLARPDWGREQYAQGHLPGAVYAHLDHDLSSPITPQSGRHPLPSAEAFAATLGRWGVGDNTLVVAYDQGNGAFAARLWWLLRAVGHRGVLVLDGGYAVWKAANLPLDTAEPARRAIAQPVRALQGWLTTAQVQHELDAQAITLVDARSPERYAGQQEPIDPVAGHVPGAINHPLTDNLAPDGRFLPAELLRQRWQQRLASDDAGAVVSMCGSGITACHNLLALEAAGLPGGRLYAGSWSEWIRDPSRPVATKA